MTNLPPQPSPLQPQHTTASWREAALARSEIITDAWEVTKTYAGRIAEWVLFVCMVMNIIEILVTLPSALSNIVLGTQVVMLDVGGFSLASMGDQARQQGDERAARRASVTGNFLIGVTIVTLLLVTLGLLFPPVKEYTDMAEKGLILVRVVMTVIYAHVIHSLRRADMQRQHAQTQVDELTTAFNQQLQQLAAELARVQQSLQQQLASELALVQESLQQEQQVLASIPVMQAQLQRLASSPVAETHKRAERPVLRALPPVQQQGNGTRRAQETRQVPRQAATAAEKFDARAFVFACLQENPAIKLAEIEHLARAAGQELSQSTASRYRKQFAARGESSTMQAASSDASPPSESSSIGESRVVG
jgi:hypothetical protein